MIQAKEKEDFALRPDNFSEYIGQDQAKELLEVTIEAAEERGDPLEHILIYGPPGMGKTTLANVIAAEFKVPIGHYIGPLLRSANESTTILLGLSEKEIVFIDEIHRMYAPAQEVLYPAMEDRFINFKAGGAQTRIDLVPFTLIGATTEPDSLEPPFIARFGLKINLETYTRDQLDSLARQSCGKLGIKLTEGARTLVIARSRGVPRILNNVLRRLRDYAQYFEETIDEDFTEKILSKKGLRFELGEDKWYLHQSSR